VFNDDTQTFWFNKDSFESLEEYELIGILMGVALYNNVILDMRFPSVVFKKLLDAQLTFQDFAEFDPVCPSVNHTAMNHTAYVCLSLIENGNWF